MIPNFHACVVSIRPELNSRR